MTTYELAKAVCEYVGKNSHRESGLLYPDPAWNISDPHGLLDIICEAGIDGVDEHVIDGWVFPQKDAES